MKKRESLGINLEKTSMALGIPAIMSAVCFFAIVEFSKTPETIVFVAVAIALVQIVPCYAILKDCNKITKVTVSVTYVIISATAIHIKIKSTE